MTRRERLRRIAGAAFALLTAVFASAHIGTTNAYFEGSAGPYPIRVIVRTPGVIPGLAQISVRITGGPQPTHITVRPLRSDAGLEGAPPPDSAKAVPVHFALPGLMLAAFISAKDLIGESARTATWNMAG